MQNLFKINPGVTAGKERVGDTDFQQHYPSVNINLMWAELTPYIRQATELYLLPFVGATYYNQLANKIQTNATLTASEQTVVTLMKDVVAYYTVIMGLSNKKTNLTSMGPMDAMPDKGGAQPSQWGFKSTIYALTQTVDKLMDKMLLYMEKGVKADEAEFDTWMNSEEFNAGAAPFFRTTAEFQAVYPINSSRRTFLAMKPIIKNTAETIIKPILCADLYTQIITQHNTDTLSDANKALLTQIQTVLARYTVVSASDALTVLPEHDGFRLLSAVDGIDMRTFAQETISQALRGIQTYADESGRTARADLISYMYLHPDDYPLWTASNCYHAPDERTDQVICVGDGGVFM